jgi:RNA polymerase sigma-B factor
VRDQPHWQALDEGVGSKSAFGPATSEAATEEKLMATATDRSAALGSGSQPVVFALSDGDLFARLRADGDPKARKALIERYLPLARRLARRYQHTDEPIEDLVQVASVGLIKAVDRFDSAREVMFSSYAVPTILGELKRHFRDRTWSVRVPRDLQELALRVDQTVTRLSIGRRRSPSVGELARAVEASEEQVLEALEAMGAYRASSLDVPRSAREEEGESMAETLGEEDRGFERAEQRATLEPLLARIGERERTVLELRFGADLTQAEIGERIGVSQMQVSRLIRQALTRLRAGAEEPCAEQAD